MLNYLKVLIVCATLFLSSMAFAVTQDDDQYIGDNDQANWDRLQLDKADDNLSDDIENDDNNDYMGREPSAFQQANKKVINQKVEQQLDEELMIIDDIFGE